MKIYRIVATEGPFIKSKYILSKNAKKAKELAARHGFSYFLIDKVQIENAMDFWNSLSEIEQTQFKNSLINNFFNKEICDE